jgi:chemotaxis protein MotB
LTAFIVLSGLVHAAALVGALTVRRPEESTSMLAPRLVFVDLPSATPALSRADVSSMDRSIEPSAPAALAQRVAELGAANTELSARVREQDERTAQLEARHRQEVAGLEAAASALGDEMAAVTADRSMLTRALAMSREQVSALEQELQARQKTEEAIRAEMEAAWERLVSSLRQEIADKDVALERANSQVTVAIVDRVLFPSGQASLTPDGARVIDKLGAVLAGMPDRRIRIEGHTDDVPVGEELRSRFPSNWELSTARATTVVQRLIDHAHITPGRLEATGRADTDPVTSNTTEAGRRRNRRIEIILLPPAAGETGESPWGSG